MIRSSAMTVRDWIWFLSLPPRGIKVLSWRIKFCRGELSFAVKKNFLPWRIKIWSLSFAVRNLSFVVHFWAIVLSGEFSWLFIFTLVKTTYRRSDWLYHYFTSEQNRVARSLFLLNDKKHISMSLGAFFFRRMASNRTNRFHQSKNSFWDGQENDNTKKKTTMLLWSMNFLFWKARRDKWTNWLLKSETSFSASSL